MRIKPQFKTGLFLLIISIVSVISSFQFFMMPGDEENVIFGGLSANRLPVMAVFIAAILLSFTLALLSVFHRRTSLKIESFLSQVLNRKAVWWCNGILFVLIWISVLIPSYRFDRYATYHERLLPFLTWSLIILGLFLFKTLDVRFEVLRKGFYLFYEEQKKTLFVSLAIFSTLVLIGVGVALSGLGIRSDFAFWNEPSIPLLGLQLILVLFCGFILLYIENHFKSQKLARKCKGNWYIDLAFFLGIWIVTAVVWNAQILPEGYFAPGPSSPTKDYTPFSDALKFETGAQTLLIGEGILHDGFTDRPVYMSFLAALHAVAGQKYSDVIRLQVCLFAIFPAILYLIARFISGRPAGLMVALAALFKEINTIIATPYASSSHSKWMMTEFPAMLLVALFCLLFLRFYHSKNSYLNLLAAGGVLGFASMVRPNPLFILPAAILMLLLIPANSGNSWRKKSLSILVLFAGFFSAILPWSLRTAVKNDAPIIYAPKILNVFSRRYVEMDSPDTSRTPTPISTPSVTTSAGAGENNLNSPDLAGNSSNQSLISKIVFIPAHFMHCVVSSVLILPVSLRLDDLKHTLTVTFPFWNRVWQGEMSPDVIIMLGLNLLVIALGLAASWRRWKGIALIPLGIYLAYYLSNGFARTSGGRYQVGVDWVVYLYFILGIACLFQGFLGSKLANTVQFKPDSFRTRQIFFGSAALLMIGASMPLAEIVIPQRFPPRDSQAVYEWMESANLFEKSEVSSEKVRQFLNSKTATLIQGRSLYPVYRFFDRNQIDSPESKDNLNYPRVEFTIIGSYPSPISVVLPQTVIPGEFPNGIDVIILGCTDKGWLDPVLTILLFEDRTVVYQRTPSAEWQCPLPAPVCNDNAVCQ